MFSLVSDANLFSHVRSWWRLFSLLSQEKPTYRAVERVMLFEQKIWQSQCFRDASRLPMQKLKTRFLVNTKSGHEWELLLNIKTRPVEAYWLSVSEMFWAYSISFNGNCLFYSLNYQLSIINSISNKSYSIVRAWSLIIPWNNLNGSCCFTLNAINSSFPGNYRDWDL